MRKVLQIKNETTLVHALILSISVSFPGLKTLSSAQISSFIGPFFLVSALMIDVLTLYPFNSGHLILGTFIKDDFSNPFFYEAYNRSLSTVAATTFLTGIIQVRPESLNF